MTAQNYPDPILLFTLREEGGFSNNPRDPGGATMHGITLKTFRNLMHDQTLTVDDLKNITVGQEAEIYRSGYWDKVKGDMLPPGVDLMVFDMGVNAGPVASEKMLQRALGFTGANVDGIIGSHTLAAIHDADQFKLILRIKTQHENHYKSLDTFDEFGDGWLARLGRRLHLAVEMAQASASVAPPSGPAPPGRPEIAL